MSIITENIIEQLKKLTLIEASELVNKIESTFDVDASSTSQTMLAAPGISNGNTLINPLEEKTEFDLILEEVPAEKKISILKAIRVITSLGLKEAKDMVEAAPKIVLKGMSKDTVKNAQKLLDDAGAKTNIK
jgi:large subunit ribosomal protein L7/L12